MSTITFDQQEYETRFFTVEDRQTLFIKLTKSEDGEYIATCPDMPGVVTSGDTEDDAIANAYEAIDEMLDAKKITLKYHLLAL